MKTTLTLITTFSILSFVSGQTFTNYTIDSGLVNNDVLCLDVAGSDVMWFGTQEGISVFNGTTWIAHTTATDTNLAHNTIQALCVLSDGNVWIGTDFGASYYNGSAWTTYLETDGLGDDRIKCITEEANGDVWFGTNDGVSIYDGITWTSYGTSDGLPFGGVTSVQFDANGDAWLGTGLGGISIFDGTTFTEITENEHLINDKIRAIAIDDNGNKWIGTANGVSVFNSSDLFVENHSIMLILPAPDTLNPVEDVKIASDGRIWTGIYVDYLVTEGGVAMFNGDLWTDYDVSDGLIGPVIRALDIDSQDNIWVTTSTGISKISGIPADSVDYWSTWSDSAAFPEDTISSTSVIEAYLQPSISVHPSPAISEITVKSINSPITRIEILTLSGAVSSSIHEMNNSSTVSIENLSSGLYFIRVYSSEQTETIRFIKL